MREGCNFAVEFQVIEEGNEETIFVGHNGRIVLCQHVRANAAGI